MGGLERLLDENYESLCNPQCKDAVRSFVAGEDDVSGRDIIFIKKLTKVAHHILRADPESFNGHLKKLLDFTLEGVDMIQSNGLGSRFDSRDLTLLESHLNSYAGDFAGAQYEKTGDVGWLQMKHECYQASAELAFEEEPRHSMYAYSIAAAASHDIYNTIPDSERDEKMKWCQRWYEEGRLSYDLGKDINPRHAATTSSLTGMTAHCMFIFTRKNVWRKRALRFFNRFLDYYTDHPDPSLTCVASKVGSKVRGLQKHH